MKLKTLNNFLTLLDKNPDVIEKLINAHNDLIYELVTSGIIDSNHLGVYQIEKE